MSDCSCTHFHIVDIEVRTHQCHCYDEYLAKNNNNKAHAANGNIKHKKTKCIEFMLMNKGNSLFHNKSDSIKHIIDDTIPHIAVINESNIVKDNISHQTEHPEYEFEHKFEANGNCTRTSMMLKKDSIDYERMHKLEDPNIATIWVKVKITPKKSILVIGGYRQWRLPSSANQPFSGKTNNQIGRFLKIKDQIRRARKINNNLVILMDSNIDLHDSMDREDIRDLKVLYNELLDENKLTIVNEEDTRHRLGNISSYLDHIATTKPGNIDEVQTIHTYFTDHDIITCLYFTNEMIFYPQFKWDINFRNLTQDNLMTAINSNQNLQKLWSMSSSEEMWSIFIEEINSIIDKLAPKCRVQIKEIKKEYFTKDIY